VSQLSSVHGFRSSQSIASPARQLPPWQASPLVQALSSLHAVPFATGVVTQPDAESQLSTVQALSSSQVRAPPELQVPDPSHVSLVVQASASAQLDPAARKRSVGQVTASPGHVSAASQSLAAGRQTNDDGW
jgi:hypothetical protein